MDKLKNQKTGAPMRYLINTVAIIFVFLILNSIMNNRSLIYYSDVIMNTFIAIILAVSLNLTAGFLGQLPLGHAAFMAIGAYASAMFTKAVNFSALPMFSGAGGLANGLEFMIALLLGGLLSAAAGILVGLPALRLRGDYLAIITLGFGEIVVTVLNNMAAVGGAKGLSRIEPFTTFPWAFGAVIVTVFVATTMIRSSHGRAMISIRENEIAAQACGVNTTYYKTLAFTVAAFFAGVAGGLYAHFICIMRPGNFGFGKSVEILVLVVLGGMGSIAGSLISATALTIIPEFLRAFSDYRMVLYSLLLILVMIFKPSGLLGTYDFSLVTFITNLPAAFRRLITWFKKRFRRGNDAAPKGGDVS